MDMFDTITVVGNVATEPQYRRMPTGVVVTSFRVACTQRRQDKATGAWADASTNWFSASAYRGLGEHVHGSLHKGDRVILTGKLRVRNWEAGEKRGTSVEIDVDAIGHDLLWGTSRFTKDAASREDAQPAPEAEWPSAAPGDWGAPAGEQAGGAPAGESAEEQSDAPAPAEPAYI
ncbi:single-stranded DNA-binding protein 1 [Microbacterium terricola]|uniref:Single-stranded DNA-binding protein n=2 Tax=Microbacterium terricola TaxID=344163 RepID=A0ABM8DZ02_9MICO|nr:single-stranded DNA-binding protein 1 [Microbacterium terricola]